MVGAGVLGLPHAMAALGWYADLQLSDIFIHYNWFNLSILL